MSEENITPENNSSITLTVGVTDSDGLEHATQSIFPISVQLFDKDTLAQSYTEDLTNLLKPLIRDCVTRITRVADLSEEERDAFANSLESQNREATSDAMKESWTSKLTKH